MNIQNILDSYLHFNPEEQKDLEQLSSLLKDQGDIISRNNFNGHITASAFILNKSGRQVLLLEHKALGRLLQPGGHVESIDTSLRDATLREIEEETGLRPSDLTLHNAQPNNAEVPFDIDTHQIPENPKKGEPAHFHHDFRYVYTTENLNIKVDPTEANTYRWVDWEDFVEDESFKHMADKIISVLEPNVRGYFRSLTSNTSKSIAVIAVSHIIPSSEAYIKSLEENFNLIGIIPKPKSINTSSLHRIEDEGITIFSQFTRDSITEDPEELIELLKPYDRICLVDIGGYFQGSISALKSALGNRLLGVIEDTENGLQKYEQNYDRQCAVMSVARSPLKNFEDQLVGHGIAHATETVLRQINILMTYRSCGIIGYGKIGRGIAEYLHQRNIRPRVCEINAMRSIQASCDGAIVCSMDEMIKESDIIFCATGARAIDIVKLRDLRMGTYLASATSSDDEFNLDEVDTEYCKVKLDPNITQYSKTGHLFYLLNDGNAINFLFSAAVDTYIYLVQGELLYSIDKIANVADTNEIKINDSKDHELIARNWLDYVMR